MKPIGNVFHFRGKIFDFFRPAIYITDEAGNAIYFSQQKAFKLKEDIRIFSDESKSTQLMHIQARKILDFSSAYDIYDSTTNQRIAVAKRKGMKSLLRDAWELHDSREQLWATLEEDSMLKAVLRRFVDWASLLLPQKFTVKINGVAVGTYGQNFNPFLRKLTADFSGERAADATLAAPASNAPGSIEYARPVGQSYATSSHIDRRVVVALGVLLMNIEGKQG